MTTTAPDPKSGYWERAVSAVENIAIKLITTGNFAWFVLLAISLACLWKLDSKDLKEVLLKAIVTYGWLGVPIAGVTIFASIRVLRWRERFYQQEMARMAEMRNKVMQPQLELPISSSVERDDKK